MRFVGVLSFRIVEKSIFGTSFIITSKRTIARYNIVPVARIFLHF